MAKCVQCLNEIKNVNTTTRNWYGRTSAENTEDLELPGRVPPEYPRICASRSVLKPFSGHF